MVIYVVQTSFSVVWLIDVCCVDISQDCKRGSLIVSHESCFSFFSPTVELARENYSWRKLENKAAQKAVQGMQQRSLDSACSVNFSCGNTDRIKQGLALPVTLHTHTGRYSQLLQPDTQENASKSLPLVILHIP